MNREEATSVLGKVMAVYRAKPYKALVRSVDQTVHVDMQASSGAKYQVDIQVVWDGPANGDLRVMGAVDDGSWRAIAPIADSFILRPDGTFAGE